MAKSKKIDEKEPIGENNMNSPVVKAALDLIQRTNLDKTEQDEKNLMIQRLFEYGFEVYHPTGTRKIDSKKLYQAMWRTANRTKPLDFQIHGSGASEDVEKIVTDGVGTVMDEGGFGESLMGKGGCFFKMYLYGDGFEMIGKNPDEESSVPIVYSPISNNNIWIDNYCTGIRGKGNGKNASEICVIFPYRWHEACRLFPGLEEKGGKGKIPRGDYDKDQDKTYLQDDNNQRDVVEVCFYFDIANKRYSVFAGRACTLLEEKYDDEYPFMFRNAPYLPVLQWICMPSSEGFYNHGIGDMIYQLALVSSQLLNMEVNHIEYNVDPLNIVSVPQGEAANFFQKLAMANASRAAGKKPYVAIEYDPNNPNGSAVSSQTLLTNNLFQEWQIVYDRLDAEIKRMGIYLDEGDFANYPNREAVIAEEENSTAFVKQSMEYNSYTTQFAVLLTMEQIKADISPKNTEPLNMTTTIVKDGQEVQVGKYITMGMLSQTLKDDHFFVKVNSRSGALPSNIYQQAQVSRMLAVTPPGSPAYYRLLRQQAQLNDRDIPMEDFQMAAPAGVPTGEMQPLPNETGRPL
ncbi:hypothetical protein KBA63_00095 [Candidatus Woesebacteria bacterium]|nr:hypothetical protein [Candidatus Woesebacteria bacterium]